jgi:hypothetical protein
MKTYLFFLPLTTLALTGCVQDKPAPQLSSPNRHERIEAVRNAHNQFGAQPAADRPVPAIDKKTLVGRWNHPWTNLTYVRFAADGTYHENTLLTSTDGTYRLLPNGRMEVSFPGTFSGRNVVEQQYRLNGDTLEIQVFGAWIAYTKAKE